MQLTKQAQQLLGHISLKYLYNNEEKDLTEAQIKEEVLAFARSLKFSAITDEEYTLIVRKLIAQFGVYKPEDECVTDESEYDAASKDWFTKNKDKYDSRSLVYRNKLIKKNWSPNVVREIDKSADTIMDLLGNPTRTKFNVRGLIMGDIQSGKTANFIALCNKAADAGYRLIIVTAGIIEKLRRQTQGRLEKEFVNLLADKPVVKLTGTTYDFRQTQGENPFSVFKSDVPVLCVVKKNVSVLQHLYKWVQKGVKKNPNDDAILLPWPLLFIDDEADNASINTNAIDDESNPTRTNELIRKILKSFTRSSYVGVTATPFANVFIDPDTEHDVLANDLFPHSFVYRLTTPSNYFGASKIFAEGSSYRKDINDLELWLPTSHKKHEYPSEEMPESLQTAISYFLLINGAMDVMGTVGDTIGHRSMMIHISRFVAIQNRLAEIVDTFVKRIYARVANYCGDVKKAERIPEIAKLHEIWKSHNLETYCNGMSWKKFLQNVLPEAIKTIEIAVVNSGNSKSLDYSGENKRYIVIGGNSLSRGLTLEGLVVSYFRRNSLMSDTLLQMGRWCGYRDGYQNLVRIWMPESALDSFGYANEISEEISETFHQIVEQGGSPKDFAFKIRKSPSALLPTARSKMRTARRVSFPIVIAGHAIETPRMRNDMEIIKANNAAVINLIKQNIEKLDDEEIWSGVKFIRDVSYEAVTEMLSNFKAGMMSFGFLIPQISEYISKLATNWDVALLTTKDSDGYQIEGLPNIRMRNAKRKFAVVSSGREILISGTKLKVTSGGAMRYILTPDTAKKIKDSYQAMLGNEKKSPPDGWYLREAKDSLCRPLLIIQYVTMNGCTEGSEMPQADSFFALSFGFPGAQEDQAERVYWFSTRAYEEAAYQDFFTNEMED